MGDKAVVPIQLKVDAVLVRTFLPGLLHPYLGHGQNAATTSQGFG
jgi:hypothetical protein